MRDDAMEPPAPTVRRGMTSARSRRPWLLVVAALLLAVLSAVLWVKWTDGRIRAERLQAELKQVYGEAEALRTQAARAQERAGQLERQLRDLSAGSAGKPAAKPRTGPAR